MQPPDDLPEITMGMRNDQGHLCADTPPDVLAILQRFSTLTSSEGQAVTIEESADSGFVSADDREVLNQFATEVAGAAGLTPRDCQVLKVHPCETCLIYKHKYPRDGGYWCVYGILACTTCGKQCWRCTSYFSDGGCGYPVVDC